MSYQRLVQETVKLQKIVLSQSVLSRPSVTGFGMLSVPTIPKATSVNVTTPAGGGTANLLAGIANRVRKVVGGYVRQTAGASRNFQIEVFDGTSAFPISDNDANSKKTSGTNHIMPTHTLRLNGVAAADTGTYQGWVWHDDFGFPAV